jgi:hypothetical protein
LQKKKTIADCVGREYMRAKNPLQGLLKSIEYEKSKRERDLRNQFQFATDKGIAEGIEIGASNVARKLKADGMDIDMIIKYSGLTREEIEKL